MRDPFTIKHPTCISFSGGRTSAYMLWRVLQAHGGLPAETTVCFASTGKEVEAGLRFVRDCGEHWHVPIRWLEYQPTEPGFSVVEFDSTSRGPGQLEPCAPSPAEHSRSAARIQAAVGDASAVASRRPAMRTVAGADCRSRVRVPGATLAAMFR